MLARLSGSPRLATAAMVLAVALAVLGLRALGLLEPVELATYDAALRLRTPAATADPRIVLVTVTESDIAALGGWPLPDDTLARALEALRAQGPRAIGLDIYRDVPVPPASGALERTLTADPRIVAVRKFAEGAFSGIPAPKVLADTEQVGFNDIVVDRGGIVRRALLYLDDGVTVLPSFALRLALLYLAAEGVGPQPDPDDESLLRLGPVTIRPLEPRDGAYAGVDARGYQFLLDFRRGPQPFRAVALSDVLAGTVPAEAIRGRVALLGVTAESVKDHFYTPLSRGAELDRPTAGVAVHAEMVGQLLRMALEGDAPVRSLPEWQEMLWIVAWTAGAGALGLALRSPWTFALAAVGGAGATAGAGFATLLGGWWIPVVPPAAGWVATLGVVTAYVSYRERHERASLMQLFSRHVDREVAETIWAQREQFLDGRRPRPQRIVITALFTDLSGYTTLSEKSSPEDLMEWLNEYMDAMAQEVSRHGGIIRQYAGDSVVAVFGAPVARATDAEIAADAVRAVDCALGMDARLRALNLRWQAEGRPVTGMRVGIFTGPVVAGMLGSAERSEYVTVGDTMNVASRLESFDKVLYPPDPLTAPCRILIGEPTLYHLGARFLTEPVGQAILKGKQQTVEIHRVLGRRESSEEKASCSG
jgi:adenylate cyclase